MPWLNQETKEDYYAFKEWVKAQTGEDISWKYGTANYQRHPLYQVWEGGGEPRSKTGGAKPKAPEEFGIERETVMGNDVVILPNGTRTSSEWWDSISTAQ